MTSPVPVVVARIERDEVEASGPDAASFLQGQLSQDVAGLAVGATTWSFVLQPQGKVDAWFRIRRSAEDSFVIDVERGWGEVVKARLERFKMRTACEIVLRQGVGMLAVRGAAVDGWLPCGWPTTVGSDLLGDDGDTAALPPDATEIDASAFDALRIADGVPAMGAELDADTIPAEAGQWVIDASVSFVKGCYTGQELVARIDSRGGNVPQRLCGLRGEGSAPLVGERLEQAGTVVGRVTSSAPAGDGGFVALGYLKRAIELPTTANAGATTVALEALPMARPVG